MPMKNYLLPTTYCLLTAYQSIRMFWGTAGSSDLQAEAYKGLGELYVNDERYTMNDGKPNPDFAVFMRNAMGYFVDTQLG